MAKKRSSENTRNTIIRNFAMWAAMSAARVPGGPKVKGENLYSDLKKINFEKLYANPDQFGKWHKKNVKMLSRKLGSIGWAAKLLNVMLKVEVYIGGMGNKKLAELIHPPLDLKLKNSLVSKLSEIRAQGEEIRKAKKVISEYTIRGTDNYEKYESVVWALEVVKKELKKELGYKTLIELEELWEPDKKSG